MEHIVEQKYANILLERGVKVPIKAPLFLRILGKKKITFVAKALSIYSLQRVALLFLSMGLNSTEEMTLEKGYELVSKHHRALSKIIAESVLSAPRTKIFVPLLARWLRRGVPVKELLYLFQLIILYGGVQDFMNTIRFIEVTRISAPMNLSQK